MTPKADFSPRIAVFPGSFNPFTIGHDSIVRRGLTIFDSIVVALGYNEHKEGCESVMDNADAIRAIYADEPRVEVKVYTGLTVEFARQEGACCILRGVRGIADFEYEQTLAEVNRRLTGIETVLMYTLPELGCISSSMVRELEHNGVDIRAMLPKPSESHT